MTSKLFLQLSNSFFRHTTTTATMTSFRKDIFAYYRCGNEVIERSSIPPEKRQWTIEWPAYNPPLVCMDFAGKPWADPDIRDPSFKPRWNQLDGNVNRQSHIGQYMINNEGLPMNPTGRTGIGSRGLLGRWGPNHAADPIVTKWKRDKHGSVVTHPVSGKPILQFVAILRTDVKQWAIPGGMVDPGEQISATLKREFCEESLNILEKTAECQRAIKEELKVFFDERNGLVIYRGPVDDPRNTDNAWMETVAVNFHDESGHIFEHIPLMAGDDAQSVRWMEIDSSLNLYANHLSFIEMTVKHRHSHW